MMPSHRRQNSLGFIAAFLASLLIAEARGEGQSAALQPPATEISPGKAAPDAGSLDKLLDMADKDVSQLSQVKVANSGGGQSLDMPVSTVSRQESTVGQSPAAVFVVTNEMIRRSGAREIPEVLRLVPGVDVARIDGNKWAVSIRGFNHEFANKLLVQIDGRAVYTPLYAGVFWDVQDVLLEDVERIEVIRGPGATVWGANAVNGVINIITKDSKDTQGVYVESGGGSFEKEFTSARYGGRIGENATYRMYGKWFERGDGFSPDGNAFDASGQARGGMKVDWTPSTDDHVTLQGDCYNGYSGQFDVQPRLTSPYMAFVPQNVHVEGDNAMLTWRHVLGEKSDWTAWTYFDQTLRHWPGTNVCEHRDTLDFDFQHRFPLGDRNEVIWEWAIATRKRRWPTIRLWSLSIRSIAPTTSSVASSRIRSRFKRIAGSLPWERNWNRTTTRGSNSSRLRDCCSRQTRDIHCGRPFLARSARRRKGNSGSRCYLHP